MKKLLFIIIFFCLAKISYSADMDKDKEKILFIGNPGVGKSAIINALMGEEAAKSGLCFGTGLTKYFNTYAYKNYVLIDTPGLSDIKSRKEAAEEIEKALKQNGVYRIFFVMTLEAGRLKTDDLTTLNVILDAVKKIGGNFNVIINKLNRQEYYYLDKNKTMMINVFNEISSAEHIIGDFFAILKDSQVEEGYRKFIPIDLSFKRFLFEESKFLVIKSKNISPIEVDKIGTMKAGFEAKISDMQKMLENGEQAYKALAEQMQEVRAALQNSAAQYEALKAAYEEAEERKNEALEELKAALATLEETKNKVIDAETNAAQAKEDAAQEKIRAAEEQVKAAQEKVKAAQAIADAEREKAQVAEKQMKAWEEREKLLKSGGCTIL